MLQTEQLLRQPKQEIKHLQSRKHHLRQFRRLKQFSVDDTPTAIVPHGPPPKDVASTRVLPDVHDALRQRDPSKAPASQPSRPKKAPPTTGKGMPAGFYRVEEPPRIGSGQVQPATYRSTSQTSSRGGEPSCTQASSTSASSAGSTQQASVTQGISRNSTRRFDDINGSTFRS